MTRDWLVLKFAYSLCSSLFFLIRVKLDKFLISIENRQKNWTWLTENVKFVSNIVNLDFRADELALLRARLRVSHIWSECQFTSVMKIADIFRKIKSVRKRNAYQLLGTKAKKCLIFQNYSYPFMYLRSRPHLRSILVGAKTFNATTYIHVNIWIKFAEPSKTH